MKILRLTIVILGIAGVVCPGTQLARADAPRAIVFLTWKPNQPEVWKHQNTQCIRACPVGPGDGTGWLIRQSSVADSSSPAHSPGFST